jgi:2-keto-3-deoxy-galactonokinase
MLTCHALSSHAMIRATAEGNARISQDTKGCLQGLVAGNDFAGASSAQI